MANFGARDFPTLSDEDLVERGAAQEALVRAEFLRRQTLAMRQSAEHEERSADAMVATAKATADAAEATRNSVELLRQTGDDQKRAADAMVETAKATRDNARYVWWSVIAVVAMSALNLAVQIIGLIVQFLEHTK